MVVGGGGCCVTGQNGTGPRDKLGGKQRQGEPGCHWELSGGMGTRTLKTDADALGDLLSIFSQDSGCPENPRQQGWDFLSEFRLG